MLYIIFLFYFCYKTRKKPKQIQFNQKIDMQKAVIIIAVLTLLAGWQLFSSTSSQQSNLTLDPPATVPFVNISKYVGLWYEQASIPQIFQ